MQPIRTLVLSGGGGRGAFHAGVYKYLSEENKIGLDGDHQACWSPDIVVGTSIGAVNGAAIVQGITSEQLELVWRSLREQDIQGLPPGMSGFTRWVTNLFLRSFIGVRLPQVPKELSTSPAPEQSWELLPFGPRSLNQRIIGRWNNLLDTGPLKRTLQTKLGIDPQKISDSEMTLLITATKVQTGERMMFSNHPIISRHSKEPRSDVVTGINLDRILASCSIPLVYPWTWDEQTAQFYWDGAVVANTPLSGALDAAQEWPIEIPMEVVVVLMTPWVESGKDVKGDHKVHNALKPQSFGEALTTTLDWALLASFRERLRVTEAYNQLARLERQYIDHDIKIDATLVDEKFGQTATSNLKYRQVNVIIIAPDEFFPMARILDYDERNDQLIELGYQASKQAFRKHFSSEVDHA